MRSNRLHSETVSEDSVVRCLIDSRVREFQTGRMTTKAIAKIDEHPEFIHGEPVVNAVGQVRGDVAGVVTKRLCCVARFPAPALVLQRLWEVPVIQCRERANAIREQLVDESIVEVQALWIRRSSAARNHA